MPIRRIRRRGSSFSRCQHCDARQSHACRTSLCRALARDGQIVHHLYQRLVDLGHIAGENGPVVHLGVYVHRIVGMPRRAQLLIPDALKRRWLRAGARRGYREIASEVEQQGVESDVILVFLEIAQTLAGRYVVFAVRAYVELNSRIERAVVGDVRGFDRFVIEILRESLDAGLKVRLAVCESVVLPAVEARLCGEIERDDVAPVISIPLPLICFCRPCRLSRRR